MLTNIRLPQVRVDPVAVRGGMDTNASPMFAKPGTSRLAYNYEYSVLGGADRIRGIEPFDGRPSPSAAAYVYLKCAVTITGVSVGDTLVGATSAVTGVVAYLSGAFVAMTKVSGTFLVEGLKLGATTVATITSLTEAVDGFLDNIISKASADIYQVDITKVPGSGPGRGAAILNDAVYAWRNNAGGTALATYKSSAAGWVLVPLYHQVSFTAGTAAYAEGSTITQGAVTATVKRVVLESGAWTGTAAGRLIITTPSGGSFAAGASAGGGACTLSGANAVIVLAPGGKVRTHAYNFSGQLATRRLYCCDGINPEFEFDGDVLAPITTGMGSTRATAVKCHRHHLFFAYKGSLQHSGVGFPYVWSAVFGAGELATGDDITNLISIGGTTDAAALMATCKNSLHILYGSSTLNFVMQPMSHISGASVDSAQDIGGVVALDSPGVIRYPATRSFGNFAWDTMSLAIQSIAANQSSVASVYVPGLFKYRLFFTDGTAISGLPVVDKSFEWSIINYGRNIVYAINDEIAGVARTFYQDDQGWVYEADVGRSFAGDSIPYAMVLHYLSQRSPQVEKGYKQMQLEVTPKSACTLKTSAQFYDGTGPTATQSLPIYGSGLIWDLSAYDASYWDTLEQSRKAVPCEGAGTAIAITVAGDSANELTHVLHAASVLYTTRKIAR